jgi:hypothetical protein
MRRLESAVRRIASCVATSPRLCAELLFWRTLLPILKFIVPVRLLAQFMWSPASEPVSREGADARLQSLLHIWQHGGRLLVSSNCLERSLVLYRLLSQYGSNPRLILGVNRADGRIAGHAWIEKDGRAFLDDTEHSYERLAIFGVNGRPAEIRP